MSRRGAREAGLTLIELLVSVAILGIVVPVIGAAIIIGFNTMGQASTTLAAAHPRDIVQALFPHDAASAYAFEDAAAISGSGAAVNDCVPAGSTPIARLSGAQATATGPVDYRTVYFLQTNAGTQQLIRQLCTAGGGGWVSQGTFALASGVTAAQLLCYGTNGAAAACNAATARAVLSVTDGTGQFVNAGWHRGQFALPTWTVPTSTTSTSVVTVTNPGAQLGTVGKAASLTITASDSVAGDTLSYGQSGLPAGLTLNAATGVISGTPTTQAVYSVTITVTDSEGSFASVSFTWSVAIAGQLVAQGKPAFCADEHLHATGAGAGSQVEIYTCDATAAETWQIPSDGTLRIDGLCVALVTDVTWPYRAKLAACNVADPFQQWRLNTANGYSLLINQGATAAKGVDYCLDDSGATWVNNNPVIGWHCKYENGTDLANQSWILPPGAVLWR